MTTDLIPIQETVSLPISVEDAIAQWNEYQELTRRLLDASDYQSIGQRKFKKKSAWRKYARAFNISDRKTSEEIKRFEDGFPIYARIWVEARHPNGRTAEADHECHVSERCCVAAQGLPCEKRTWRGHSCCPPGCSGRQHWSHPGDLPATATTRAKNRAISDLIGAGEVSAEEMMGQRDIEQGVPETQMWEHEGPEDSGPGPVSRPRPVSQNAAAPASASQRQLILTIGKEIGMADDELTINEVEQFTAVTWADLTSARASAAIEHLKRSKPAS